nr:MAG TPA: hypothetical protein [Caudoviricetes sp.]
MPFPCLSFFAFPLAFSLWLFYRLSVLSALCVLLSRPSLKRVYPLQVICGEFPF